MTEEFMPRIVVTNDDDAATVGAALIMYVQHISARAIALGDLESWIPEVRRSVDLLETVRDAAIQKEASARFGPMPDDAEMAEQLEKFRKSFGENPDN